MSSENPLFEVSARPCRGDGEGWRGECRLKIPPGHWLDSFSSDRYPAAGAALLSKKLGGRGARYYQRYGGFLRWTAELEATHETKAEAIDAARVFGETIFSDEALIAAYEVMADGAAGFVPVPGHILRLIFARMRHMESRLVQGGLDGRRV